MRLKLNKDQRNELHNALLHAFDRDELDMMLDKEADKRLNRVARRGVVDDVAFFDVVLKAEAQGWTDKLILGAAAWRPDDPVLAGFLDLYKASSVSEGRLAVRAEVRDGAAPHHALQRILGAEANWSEFERFLARLGQLESLVCRIELNGRALGSGFLVAPDLVLTNCHVLEGFRNQPGGVACRFDYRRIGDTAAERPGVTFGLAQTGWLVADSPWAPGDDRVGGRPPREDELDYALLRLRVAAGDTPKGQSIPGTGEPRGHVRLQARAGLPQRMDPVFLLQHPLGEPLKLAVGSVLDQVNDARLRYTADSEAGSSGSPLFDRQLELVGLHHATDPDFDPGHAPGYNQGVPIGAIVRDLRDRVRLQPIWE